VSQPNLKPHFHPTTQVSVATLYPLAFALAATSPSGAGLALRSWRRAQLPPALVCMSLDSNETPPLPAGF